MIWDSLSIMIYKSKKFNDVPVPIRALLWALLDTEEMLTRMTTATDLERPAVEALARPLLDELDPTVLDSPRVRQMLGDMVRELLEQYGFEIERQNVRITRPGPFSTAALYRRAGEPSRSARNGANGKQTMITREDRKKWAERTKNDDFNAWFNPQIQKLDGTLDLDKMNAIATAPPHNLDIGTRYSHLNPGHQRMVVGNLLRKRRRELGL
jgi:hypothetical protein